jgi:hypothetical protein
MLEKPEDAITNGQFEDMMGRIGHNTQNEDKQDKNTTP